MMEQREIFDALATYLSSGDAEPWLNVMAGLRTGEVVAEKRHDSLTFRAVKKPVTREFGDRLTLLREQSGKTYRDIGDALDVSTSSVMRHCAGQTLGQWPVVSAIIRECGGDPGEFRDDYNRARAERTEQYKSSRASNLRGSIAAPE